MISTGPSAINSNKSCLYSILLSPLPTNPKHIFDASTAVFSSARHGQTHMGQTPLLSSHPHLLPALVRESTRPNGSHWPSARLLPSATSMMLQSVKY
ncbi:hypothetical protein L596_024985 [Steinernema carpocapsae]|uniref:Uncharacterized protein n=1 Tax=Steinernema carpocapsae TaxID=34508 RepID=A0A4U5M6G5_STECR|nr:hypothetical protein L596_024985 [Steinernema carpocapsae]